MERSLPNPDVSPSRATEVRKDLLYSVKVAFSQVVALRHHIPINSRLSFLRLQEGLPGLSPFSTGKNLSN